MKRAANEERTSSRQEKRGFEQTPIQQKCEGDQASSYRIDPDVSSALVASEMTKLSLKERTTAIEDVHGVRAIEEEPSPEAIASLTARVTELLAKRRHKPAYAKALFLCPGYVNDPGFILMFLRSSQFDVFHAAKCILVHFEEKLKLFGVEKLGRKITFDDLNEDDKAALLSGSQHVLPKKDRSGRTVLLTVIDKLKYKAVENQVIIVEGVSSILAHLQSKLTSS